MSDLQKYIKKRKEQDKEFANGYDEGYMKEEYDFINSVKNPYAQKEKVVRKLTQEEGGGYLAEYTYLKGCMADGETKIEALQELEKAKESWFVSAKEFT